MSRMRLTAIAVGAVALAGLVAPSLASAGSYSGYSCYDLWYARNQIYAENGYCFKTQLARQTFGAGCFPPYGRLSKWEARRVEQIRREERRRGCHVN
ncbi:MAG: YARHG domain-containing protein [Hyphomicrobiaceae bacterium]